MSSSVGLWTKSWCEVSNFNVRFFDSIPSTNAIAKEIPFTDPPPVLILSDFQTKGRGRGANTWISTTPGSSLLSSWVFMLESPPQPISAPLIGLAVYKALQIQWPRLHFSLKAPNDIYLGEKKLAGLLLESTSMGSNHRLVIGLGLNVNETPQVSTATSLAGAMRANVNQTEWGLFLNHLLVEINFALSGCVEQELSIGNCLSIKEALNKNPLLPEKFTEVKPDGSLLAPSRTVSWSEL